MWSWTNSRPSVWSLLQRLSTQPSLHEALLTLKPPPVDWEELLSSQSLVSAVVLLTGVRWPHRGYRKTMRRRRRRGVSSCRETRWVDGFLSQGGFTRLFTILCTNPRLQTVGRVQEAEATFTLRQKCLGLLLRLVYHLLLSAMRVQKPELGGVARIVPQPIDDSISQSELEVEAKWVTEEAERESKEDDANGPAFLTYMHGPRLEHEVVPIERKEREEKVAGPSQGEGEGPLRQESEPQSVWMRMKGVMERRRPIGLRPLTPLSSDVI